MKKQYLILALAFVVIFGASAIGYSALQERYDPAPQTPAAAATPAADFTVLRPDGEAVSLSDFAGQPVVINFWATWCPPCRAELPFFENAYAEYGDEVAFMMVNLTDGQRETVEIVEQFLADGGYTFPVYYDTSYSAANAYNTFSIPVSVFVDAAGNVAASQLGAMDEETLLGYIERILP